MPGRQAVYLAELLGRYGHQKWVLVFSAIPDANEQLFVITLASTNPEEAVSQLHKHGITEATVVLEGRGARVYIWTQNHEQDADIHALSEDNHGTIEVLTGKSRLIGDDDRAKAQKIFDNALAAYEREHHVDFSRQLGTRKLRKVGSVFFTKFRHIDV